MPTLTAAQIDRATSIEPTITVNLWKPPWNRGPIIANAIGRDGDLFDCACWQWALWAGNPDRRTNEDARSAITLYAGVSTMDEWGRAQEDINLLEALGNAHTRGQITAAWQAVKNADAPTDRQKITFMERMMAAVITANGMTVTNQQTPYSIQMTVPGHEWYSWQHWGIAIHHLGQTRYFQTTPSADMRWGTPDLEEARRPGHLQAGVYVTGLKQRHIDVIRTFLSIPACRNHACTTWPRPQMNAGDDVGNWHRCTGASRHDFCNQCASGFRPYMRWCGTRHTPGETHCSICSSLTVRRQQQ